MSESVKFEFSISVDELKSCERLANMPESQRGESSTLAHIDFAHFRNVVYRLRQAFAGVPNGPAVTPTSVTEAGAVLPEPPAREPLPKLDCVGGEGGKITFSQIQK